MQVSAPSSPPPAAADDPAPLLTPVCPLTPSILRKALDKIAEIKSLLEERRIGECSPALCLSPRIGHGVQHHTGDTQHLV